MIKYKESNIDFEFPDEYKVIKFDDSNFYRHAFNRLPGGKGVDFLIETTESLIFLEVKNCTGHEPENRKRTQIVKDGRAEDGEISFDAKTFDAEVSAKVALSLACLVGAYTKGKNSETAQKLEPYFKFLTSESVRTQKKDVIVILVLEGNFEAESRSKKMQMGRIQDSIRSKLDWVAVKKVSVVDCDTYKQRYFTMIK